MTKAEPFSLPSHVKIYGGVAEIVPNALYFASLASHPKSDAFVRYLYIDQKVHYDPFYTDFGPLNLSVLHRFTQHLHALVEARSKRKIVAYTSAENTNRVNGAFLMAGYLMIYHGLKADLAYLKVKDSQPPSFIGFRDAAMGASTYDLHLHDVLRGLEQGLNHKWYDSRTFDADEYEFYERVENGDFNWILPNKILSFCGPHERSVVENGYPYHAPEVYFDYFQEHNITTIVRLNMRMYDARRFTDAGFQHVDLFFVDGSTPSDDILRTFIKVVDNAKGGVAIHCKAGLGRTGTLIACWMMKEYGISAPECMAWLRICRPGSVIGPQQEYLLEKQEMCWRMGGVCNSLTKRRHVSSGSTPSTPKKIVAGLTSKVDDIRLQGSARTDRQALQLPIPHGIPKKSKMNPEEELDAEGRSQGDRLLACKARHAHFTSPTTPIKPIQHKGDGAVTTPRLSAARNILHSPLGQREVVLPISKVTVTEAKPCSSKSAVKKMTVGVRPQPYPAGVRIEMPASSYQLRPRRSFSPNSFENAKILPPNAAALGAVTTRRSPKNRNV